MPDPGSSPERERKIEEIAAHSTGMDSCTWIGVSIADGQFDPGFGTGGIVWNNPSPYYDTPYDIAVDATHLYAVGRDGEPGPAGQYQWRIEKRSILDGLLDPGFGVSGVVLDNPGPLNDAATSIVIDSSHMYVAGNEEVPGLAATQWRILKLALADGSPDPCFGTAGAVTSDPSVHDDGVGAIAADSTGIYIAGWDRASGAGNSQMRLEKRLK